MTTDDKKHLDIVRSTGVRFGCSAQTKALPMEDQDKVNLKVMNSIELHLSG